MNNFGVRLYQSGKTRRRNANKKRQFERYRQFVAEERKLESNEITFSKDKKVSKTDETQLVELINDVKVTDNAMTAEQNNTAPFPDLLCLASVNDLEENNGKKQRVDINPSENVDARLQAIADIVESPFPKCTPIVLPTVLNQYDSFTIENNAIAGSISQSSCNSLGNTGTDDDYEMPFNFLLANKEEERAYTVECIRLHDYTKAYGYQTP